MFRGRWEGKFSKAMPDQQGENLRVRDSAHPARRAGRQGSLRTEGLSLIRASEGVLGGEGWLCPGPRTGCLWGQRQRWGGRAGPRPQPSSGCGWKPADTAYLLPPPRPCPPSALQQRSRLAVTAALLPPRWGPSLNPIPGETGASDPRCFAEEVKFFAQSQSNV